MTIKQTVYRLNRRDLRFFPKISSTLKIFLLILTVFAAVFTTKIILAQEQTEEKPKNLVKEMQDNMAKGNNQESWLDNGNLANLVSLRTMTSGTIPDKLLEEGFDPNKAYIPGGLIGITNQIVASTYNSPASGIEYIAQLKNDFLGKPAYAANETGFDSLKAIMGLWKTFRNVVYVLISLYFIVLGLMIMLRIKISPQAVITIQSSLPKVVTTLVLVTFSYAIAGFCIDLINVFQAIGLSLLFKGAGKTISSGEGLFPVSCKQWSIINLFNLLLDALGEHYYKFQNISNANFWMVKELIQRLAPNSVLLLLGGVLGTAVGAAAGVVNPIGGVLGGLIGFGAGAVIFSVIVSIIIIVYMIKLCMGLCKTYINVLLQIIFSPFLIFIGIFPTSKKGFSDWITNLIANLAVFPATLLFLVIANLLVDTLGGQGFLGGAGTGLWAPLLVQGPFAWFLPTVVGISAIAMLSKIPQIVPEAIFGLKPSPLGKALGEGFGALPGAGFAKNQWEGVKRQSQENAGALYKQGKEAVYRKMGFENKESKAQRVKEILTTKRDGEENFIGKTYDAWKERSDQRKRDKLGPMKS